MSTKLKAAAGWFCGQILRLAAIFVGQSWHPPMPVIGWGDPDGPSPWWWLAARAVSCGPVTSTNWWRGWGCLMGSPHSQSVAKSGGSNHLAVPAAPLSFSSPHPTKLQFPPKSHNHNFNTSLYVRHQLGIVPIYLFWWKSYILTWNILIGTRTGCRQNLYFASTTTLSFKLCLDLIC